MTAASTAAATTATSGLRADEGNEQRGPRRGARADLSRKDDPLPELASGVVGVVAGQPSLFALLELDEQAGPAAGRIASELVSGRRAQRRAGSRR